MSKQVTIPIDILEAITDRIQKKVGNDYCYLNSIESDSDEIIELKSHFRDTHSFLEHIEELLRNYLNDKNRIF